MTDEKEKGLSAYRGFAMSVECRRDFPGERRGRNREVLQSLLVEEGAVNASNVEDCTRTPINQLQSAYDKKYAAYAQSVVAAMAAAADKVAQDGIQEDHFGRALFALPEDKYVYLPADGLQASLEYKPAFDAHPAASVLQPLGHMQWQTILGQWLLDAALDIADILSDAQLCLALVMDLDYQSVPLWFKATYISLTLTSFGAEVIIAAVSAYGDYGMKWSEVGKYYGRLQQFKVAAMGILLKYTAVSNTLIEAPYKLQHHELTGLVVESGVNVGCRPLPGGHVITFPVLAHVSNAKREYEQRHGFLSKLVKVVVEDCALFALNLYMMVVFLNKATAGTVISATLSAYSLFANTRKFVAYVRSVRMFQHFLQDAVRDGSEHAQRALAEVNRHPLRRCIARM